MIYTDGFRAYDGLANFGYKRHFRIKHSENQFAEGKNHFNGIENFWGVEGQIDKIQRGCINTNLISI